MSEVFGYYANGGVGTTMTIKLIASIKDVKILASSNTQVSVLNLLPTWPYIQKLEIHTTGLYLFLIWSASTVKHCPLMVNHCPLNLVFSVRFIQVQFLHKLYTITVKGQWLYYKPMMKSSWDMARRKKIDTSIYLCTH